MLQATAVFSRAFVAAYQQALQNAKTGGGAASLAKNMKGKMQTDEAIKILNLDSIAKIDPKLLEQVCTVIQSLCCFMVII